MDDEEFLDLLYQQWSKTTGADTTFWMTEETEKVFTGEWFNPDEGKPYWAIFAVNQDEEKSLVGMAVKEVDADFIAAVHGCLPDLVRRMHQALDEAERFDCNRDERECRIAELELENQELREKVAEQEMMLDEVGR